MREKRIKEINDAVEELAGYAAEAGFHGYPCDWVIEKAKALDAELRELTNDR